MPWVALDNVTKTYPAGVIAVENLCLELHDGELLVLIGPSGSGKTTILRLIAGLEQPTSGNIRFDGRVMNAMPPAQRNVGFVFQRPALYPHRTVRENLGFSLKLRRSGWRRVTAAGRQLASTQQHRVLETAAILGLEGVLDRYPAQLSGGQQQRVALGRALVNQPQILLLDEPLSNLDAVLRRQLRSELHLLQQHLHGTMVYVTHDPVEAISLADRLAVLEKGRVRQIDRPEALLQNPADRFVASFACWPPLNFLDIDIKHEDSGVSIVTCAGVLPAPAGKAEDWKNLAGRALTLGIGPQDVVVADGTMPGAWTGKVLAVEPGVGDNALVTLSCGPVQLTAWVPRDCQNYSAIDRMKAGSNVMVHVKLESAHVFDRVTGKSLKVSPSG